ncbi:MAG: hypothetical protein ACO1PW_14770, partial [Actinomycetota bacterium]
MREDAKPTFRRTRRTAAAVGAASLLTFLATDPGSAAPAAPAQDGAFNAGTGTAIALGYKVNPTQGNLSFGITAGESVAGHQNTAATGQARAINLGVIGVTLAGEGCDGGDATLPEEQQPQPVIVSSSDEGAAEGRSEKEAEVITKKARATADPYAEAITEIAPLGEPGAVYITGGRTVSHSGVVAEGVREAMARTEIAEISIAGAIKLKGLTWQAVHRSGAEELAEGTFTIEGLEVAGETLPLPNDAFEQLSAINALLEPLGLRITPPGTRVEQGIVFVDPLKIEIVASPTRDALTQPLLGGIQEPREALVDALTELDCGNSTYVTVADLALGSITGAGSLGLELGGVQATTAEITAFQFPSLPPLPELPPTPSLGGGTPSLGGSTPAFESTTPPAPAAGSAGEPATSDPVSEEVAADPIVDLSGERGGLMALVAGGGLAALLASAEA